MELKESIRNWARELGFAECRIAAIDLAPAARRLRAWLDAGRHGGMDYMERHFTLRTDARALLPGARAAVLVRMDYLPAAAGDWRAHAWAGLADPARAMVSRYAQGRDYHKVLRARLQKLVERIDAELPATAMPGGTAAPHHHRVFTDSAPVMEVELAVRAGLGWRGKHTLLLDRDGGSMFFLGGFYTTLDLPADSPRGAHCGSCRACLDICPTQAIVAPYELDARRCISYLTIEHAGTIPRPWRAAIGNRIYGCDDCQLVCPWNKYARRTPVADFTVRADLDRVTLLDLWHWSETEFDTRTAGSPIRRIGWERWRRNLAVGLGNALRAAERPDRASVLECALGAALPAATPLVAEHIAWALEQAHPGLTKGTAPQPRTP